MILNSSIPVRSCGSAAVTPIMGEFHDFVLYGWRRRYCGIGAQRLHVMAKLPSFQFYPGDWRKDPDLQRCSLFAKGLLVEILCLMHESASRGRLCEFDGITPWKDEDIIIAASGGTNGAAALAELETKNVLKRDENGVLYSSRMVRDDKKREVRARSGALGGLAKAKQSPSKSSSKQPSKILAKASSSSSSSSSTSMLKKGAQENHVPAEADRPIWDAVVSIWHPSGVATNETEELSEIVAGYGTKGATPATIRERADTYRAKWPKIACTAKAVLKNWDQLVPVAKVNPSNPPTRKCTNADCGKTFQTWQKTCISCGADTTVGDSTPTVVA